VPPTILQSFPLNPAGDDWRDSPPVLSANGLSLCTHVVSLDGKVDRTTIFDVRSGKTLREFNDPATEAFHCLSPDGKRAAVIRPNQPPSSYFVRVIELDRNRVTFEHEAGGGYCLFTPDGKRLLFDEARPKPAPGYPTMHLAVADLETGRVVAHLALGQWDAPADLISSDGRMFVTVDRNDAHLKVWDISTSRTFSTPELRAGDTQRSLCFINGDKSLRGIDDLGVIRTWDVNTGKLISRVEPSERPMFAGTLSADGKFVIRGGYGGVVFEDAETARDLRVWRFGSEFKAVAYPQTFRGDTMIAGVGGQAISRLVLLKIPPWNELHLPESADERERRLAADRARDMPATAPAAAPPAHSDADLRSAAWWLDRAEAECPLIPDLWQQRAFEAQIMIARAAIGDTSGERRMEKVLEGRFPNIPPNRSPVVAARAEADVYELRRLVSSGKIDEAIKAAGGDQSKLACVAAGVARKGDVDRAVALFHRVGGERRGRAEGTAAWLLLVDGHAADAERLASHIDDEKFRRTAYTRIAEYWAQQGDLNKALVDFANVPPGRLDSSHMRAVSRIIAALAKRKGDDDARRFIELLPEKERNDAWGRLAEGQLDRDDVDAARHTFANISGNAAYWLREPLVQAQVRVGETQQAIDTAAADRFDGNLAYRVISAAIECGKLDVAAEMLKRLPNLDGNEEFSRTQKNILTKHVVVAFANADRLADAKNLLATVKEGQAPEGQRDADLYASWSIAAADRRAGNRAAYEVVRRPLVDALQHAEGAPSREQALAMLLAFDVRTDNFQAAEGDLAQCDQQMLRAADQIFFGELHQDRPTDSQAARLQRTQAVLRLICQTLDRGVIELAMGPVVKAHAEQKKYSEWLEFAQKLPSPRARIAAYLGMAQLLAPTDPPEPNE
jgi:WD40 repeat protein